MALKFIGKFWKEIVITILLTLVLFGVVEIIGTPMTPEEYYSTFSNVMQVVLAIVPIVPAIIAGVLVKRSAGNEAEVLIVPAFSLLVAGIIVTIYLLYPLSTLSEADWAYGYTEQVELMLMDVPIEQFQLVTYLQIIPSALQILLSYVGMGFIGGALALKIKK